LRAPSHDGSLNDTRAFRAEPRALPIRSGGPSMHRQGGTLAAHDISVHRGGDAVLERVSLAVTSGSPIGVVGPNGRGKATLLRALAGLEDVDTGAMCRDP